MASNYQVLVLGLDGATFDLMLPWVEQGHLPCLGKLLREGAWSRLQSTLPPITPCAWSSFMTGKNPGKHGLFDFVEVLPNGQGFQFTNASTRHAESLWSYLSRRGRRVNVVNVPMTYPPEKINGAMISGLDTPNDRCKFTYPETLLQDLRNQSINYQIDIQHLGNMRTDARRDCRLKELCDAETERTKTLQYLSKQSPYDFAMLVYTATDQVQHHFWHYMDPKHDKYDAKGAERYKNAIRDVYIHVDGLLESVLKELGENTIVMIMSDHGFGPTSNVRLRLNQALEHAGLLTFKKEMKSTQKFRSLAGKLDGLLRATLSNRAKRLIAGMFPRLRVWFEKVDEAQIDWDKTIAYTNEAFRACPAVWINHRALENHVGSNGCDAYEKALRETEETLKSLKDPKTGKPAISNIYRTRELYEGASKDKAPDLILSWWEDGFLLDQSAAGGPASLDVERSTGPITGGVEFAGSHRMDGVFIMAGGPTRRGHAFNNARIIDVAPTVLYLMDLPIPGDMDGRPLVDALDAGFVSTHPFQIEEGGQTHEVAPGQEVVFSEEESQMIAERLQSLGYIE